MKQDKCKWCARVLVLLLTSGITWCTHCDTVLPVVVPYVPGPDGAGKP